MTLRWPSLRASSPFAGVAQLRRVVLALLMALSAGVATWSGRAAADEPDASSVVSVERVALLVAADDGGPERQTLRYSESDAHALAEVLRNLGGLDPSNEIRVYGATPAKLRAAFKRVAERAQEASRRGSRVELVFYYSGHSDETGLLLGRERVSYERIRNALDGIGADVRIAILDSCSSGAFTRAKGGVRQAPFLAGRTAKVSGHAYLTSSSADEAAQESDRIGGSFFTHFLTSGLRGAADQDGDKLVTLDEAYRFAFAETLARTETSLAGAQHAAYEIQLSGSGDLVLTDLRRATGRLVLASDVGGRVSVRNANGQLMAELMTAAGHAPLQLAVEPGVYTITVDGGTTLSQTSVKVPNRGAGTVRAADLTPLSREQTTARGTALSDDYLRVPFAIGLMPAVSVGGAKRPKIVNFSASLLWSHAARVHGIAMALAADIASEEVKGTQWTLGASISRGPVVGVQMTTGVNYAQSVRGAQLTTLANVTQELHGVQITSGMNWAGSFRGAQIGIINAGKRGMRGLQLGLLNVGGDVDGAQLGLINVARSSDASLGLFSATKEGGVHPEVWTSDTALLNAGIRFPARYTYGFLAAGLHPFGRGEGWQFGFGFGGHIPVRGPLSIDIDLSGYATFLDLGFRGGLGSLSKLRAMVAWEFLPRVTVFGGPTFNVSNDPADHERRLGYGWSVWQREFSDTTVRLWPGFVAGVRF